MPNLFPLQTPAGQGGALLPLEPTVITGSTAIDDSVQTETTTWNILTIQPATGAPLRSCRVVFDMAKATTGYGAVETSATINFSIGRKVDGTNYRFSQPVLATALTGTVAATGRSAEIDCGAVGVTEACRIYAVMSADATADIDIPYMVIYEAREAPTVTGIVAT